MGSMETSNPLGMETSKPLVWVRQGDSDNPARLIFEENGQTLVEWVSSERQEWVQNSAVSYQSSRRHDRRKGRKRRVPESSWTSCSCSNNNNNKPSTSIMTSTQPKLASDSSMIDGGPSKHSDNHHIDAAAAADDDDDDDDDDEVEFLLTIFPPSPKKKAKTTANAVVSPPTTTESSLALPIAATTTTSRSDDPSDHHHPQQQQHSPLLKTQGVVATATTMTAATTPVVDTWELSALPRRALWNTPVTQIATKKKQPPPPPPEGNEMSVLEVEPKHKNPPPNCMCNSIEMTTNDDPNAANHITSRPLLSPSPKRHKEYSKIGCQSNSTATASSTVQPSQCSYSIPLPSPQIPILIAPQHFNKTVNTILLPRVPTPLSKRRTITTDCTNLSQASATTATTTNVTPRSFSVRTSAYLQSLAEICYTILDDVRWRSCGAAQRPLFTWEGGEDLSAVRALAGRYLHPPPLGGENNNNSKRRPSTCGCLLCRDGVVAYWNGNGGKNGDDKKSTEAATSCKTEDDREIHQKQQDPDPSSVLRNDDDDKEEGEGDAYDRALDLYARLYSRKGPWFRLDDLFRYYIPKKQKSEDGSVVSTVDNGQNPAQTSPTTPKHPTTFFLPRRMSSDSSSSQKILPDKLVDPDKIEQLLECSEDLVSDVRQLYRMGLIRSFRDEKECGLSVGEMKKYGLLKQDEQRYILAKLGGGKMSKMACHGPNTAKNTSTASNNNSNGFYANVCDGNGRNRSENYIWKQMCQQKSIAGLMIATAGRRVPDKNGTPSTTTAFLLPVSKHVDSCLLQSWATSIVLKASRVEYLSSPVLRDVSQSIKAQLLEVLAKLTDDEEEHDVLTTTTTSPQFTMMCFRLREAPLRTLQRCCRLYLCATSGPGDMRGDGWNAWRSLPDAFSKRDAVDEGGDGVNVGAAYEKDSRLTSRPGSHSWHTVAYPGREYRFKLRSCNFLRAYEALSVVSSDVATSSLYTPNELYQLQVFPSPRCFFLWELCVDIRANVDYLIELNDLFQYNRRRQARQEASEKVEDGDDIEGLNENTSESEGSSVVAADTTAVKCALDFLDVLTSQGRKRLVNSFCKTHSSDDVISARQTSSTNRELELDAKCLLHDGNEDSQPSRLQGDCEKILGAIAITCTHILAFRSQSATQDEISRIASRPWLRHLRWEGCMAYLLWDIIPILEKRGCHDFAVKALEILIFGHELPRSIGTSVLPSCLVPSPGGVVLAEVYLSRRARGKAYERLMIDYTHLLRQQQKTPDQKEATTEHKGAAKGRNKYKKKASVKKAPKTLTAADMTAQLCTEILKAYVPTGQITFCAVRALARRLKQPLSRTLSDQSLFEPNQLGLRLSNGPGSGASVTVEGKYSDWAPITDFAVANAMSAGEDPLVGRRCSYIGFEDDNEQKPSYGSLNVEELAMEFYRSGRLPETESEIKGGWEGWHDEGGKIRALFRILSSAAILGIDWGCRERLSSMDLDWATIHLTPYQGAPFDLHVGAEMFGRGGKLSENHGFYNRRKKDIDSFLGKLSGLTSEDLSSLVFETINSRLAYTRETGYSDPTLERDIQQVRTLSLLAAGFGGQMLSAIFRCLFFDYRHYSGGLPDLLLVRAVYDEEPDGNTDGSKLVDLGNWVGETFGAEHKSEEQARKTTSMFEDRDEEFLGCSKVGDSGGRTTSSFTRRGQHSLPVVPQNCLLKPPLEMPGKLQLTHNGRKVIAECMFVEVKSQNDRLDARQEDWLNILDRHGNARVCKFVKKKDKNEKRNCQKNRKAGGNAAKTSAKATNSLPPKRDDLTRDTQPSIS